MLVLPSSGGPRKSDIVLVLHDFFSTFIFRRCCRVVRLVISDTKLLVKRHVPWVVGRHCSACRFRLSAPSRPGKFDVSEFELCWEADIQGECAQRCPWKLIRWLCTMVWSLLHADPGSPWVDLRGWVHDLVCVCVLTATRWTSDAFPQYVPRRDCRKEKEESMRHTMQNAVRPDVARTVKQPSTSSGWTCVAILEPNHQVD